jgi:hypothetical protein
MKDSAWRRLLEKIHEGNVVPVVGSRLLVGFRIRSRHFENSTDWMVTNLY